ncbi:T9SS type A sorting domain-containing protein [Fibrobacter sp. UWEL]|uniref:VPS10 domain-containing protein n=1 Tax=Fibrobacter sp. UWEL TaxID=1896209 RepID=UPI00091C101D|nr:T9SS type A sorting domain-containing protein [Fibrobacter sp. UWEL]SHL41070.1 Por secretion system C-terminal sorting domain-containing protein [Fibrobacter sp. UWEL]
MFGKIKTIGIMAAVIATGVTQSNAEAYDWGNVRFDGGGFMSAILPSPYQKDLIYARTDVGGIYRWDVTKSVWVPLMDFISENDKGLYGTEAFALDPNDPARIYVLAGTGYFSWGRTAVLISKDYGSTWDTTYVGNKEGEGILAHGNGMGRQTGEKLAVDPNKSNIILCGSRTAGVFKSEDYGKTWNSLYKVATSSASGTSLNGVNGIAFVMFDESQGKLADGSTATIYIGISDTKDNLQVSKDGGKTWKVIEGGPSKYMPHRAKIVDGDMYITYADGPGPHTINSGAVMKYNIASGTWTDITPYDDNEKEDGTIAHEKNESSYGGIAIDPKDKNHIVVSTLGKYTGRHVTIDEKDNYGDRIYVTTDGGKNWIHGQHYGDVPNIDANGTDWIPGNAIHWAGSLEFDPFDNKKVWVTSGNGIFQTDDITAKVPLWKFQSKGVEETVPLDIVSIPEGPLVTAIGDYDGGVYTDINAPVKRHTPIVGSTESMGYAPLTGSLIRTGVITKYYTYESKNYKKIYRSDDMGDTWTELVQDTLSSMEQKVKGQIALNADGTVILHRPENGNTYYRSDDNGASWSEVKSADGVGRVTPDPVNPDVFYMIGSQGQVIVSKDAGKTFSKISTLNTNENYNGEGNPIRTVPGKEGHIWVARDQNQIWNSDGYSHYGLSYTEDGGMTWTDCETVGTAVAVGIGKAAPGADYETIYIWGGTQEYVGEKEWGGKEYKYSTIGMYRSTDKCKTFERINDDKHQFGGPGNGKFVQGDMNNFGVVYMSTVGRGLIVGAPEGTEFIKLGLKVANVSRSASMFQQGRNLLISVPSESKVMLYSANGKLAMTQNVSGNASVSLNKLPVGRYIVRLVTASGAKLSTQSIMVK